MYKKIDLLPIKESFQLNEETKMGRYHGSSFWGVKGFGRIKWPVAMRFKTSFNELSDPDSVGKECIEWLNDINNQQKVCGLKKNKKSLTKPLGNLEFYKAQLIDHEGEKFVTVVAMTDIRKSKYFWSEGQTVNKK